MNMRKQLQHGLSLIADIFQIAGFIGLTPAALLTACVGLIGWFTRVPMFYLVLGVIVVFAVFLFLTRQLAMRIGTISLSDGARIAYEQLRGTIWAAAAERMRLNSSPEGILDYIATGIAREIPVYGKFPPSTLLEHIPADTFKSGSIEEGAKVLHLHDQHKSAITDLTVRRADLRRAIRRMKE